MEYFKKYLCVTVDELTRRNDGEAIMSFSNYKRLAHERRINVVRKAGGLGVYALIDYNSLPERFRNLYEAKYGSPADILKHQAISDTFIEDTEARNFFAEIFRLPDGSTLPTDKIDEYTITASVLNEIIKIENDREALKKSLGGNAGSVKQAILNTVEKFREYPGHSLPGSWSRLNDTIKGYQENGYASLVSKRMGNSNSVKITKAAGMQIVALKRSKVPQYTNEQLFKEYNRIALEKGWKPLKSINSLVQFLNRPDIEPLWYDAVHGELAAKQRYGRKNKTILPSMRDALWYGDGTKLNLYYKAYVGGKLTMLTTQVYEVMDAYSEVFLGYHISPTENYEAQYRAFRMAAETANCRPFEVVTDNQGGHKREDSIQFFDRLARVSRRTMAYNPQSKSIEQAFGRFQAQILHQDWRFTGQNITAKQASSRPNLEFIEANKESLYTLAELKEAYSRAREEWNCAPHPTTGIPRIEMYKQSVNSELKPLTIADTVDLFWERTERTSTFTSSGITIQVDKKEYTYEVYDANNLPDMAFRKANTYRQFVVKYDPLDMSSVRLYTEDASGLRYVATAHPYLTIHRAIQEQVDGEMSIIRQIDEMNKQTRIAHQIEMAALEMSHGVAPEQHGLNRPRIKGMSAEAVELYMSKVAATPELQPEPISIGAMHKEISNYTYDTVSAFDKF